jgi:cytidylate kinase
MKKITIAIDGFSACGKSTMAKSLAKKIGYIYVDSGAMYRAVTLYSLQKGIFDDTDMPDIEKLKKEINNIRIDFKLDPHTQLPITYLNSENVEAEIRTMEVSDRVSKISAIGFVRQAMVSLQQEMGKSKGIIMDGRDIGTVVFPDAELKIFVTASPEIRTQRRLDELRSKGDDKTTFEQVFENLKERDYMDQTRKDGPLKKAEDAIELDNSYLSREEQMQWLLDRYDEVTQKL